MSSDSRPTQGGGGGSSGTLEGGGGGGGGRPDPGEQGGDQRNKAAVAGVTTGVIIGVFAHTQQRRRWQLPHCPRPQLSGTGSEGSRRQALGVGQQQRRHRPTAP